LIVVAALLLVLGLAAGYRSSLTPVTLSVNGESRAVHTQQETVSAFLLDAGLLLHPEDTVSPGIDQPIEAGMTIIVTRATLVKIEADGNWYQIRTQHTDPNSILDQAGVALGPHDEIEMEEVSFPRREPNLRLVVHRAIPVSIQEGDQSSTLITNSPTVGSALNEAGFTLYLADYVEPDLGQPLSEGLEVRIERSHPVTVLVDGRALRTRTHRDVVGDVLADLGIVLTGQDYSRPALESSVNGDITIEVTRVTERIRVEQDPIPFQVVVQPDPELEIDNQRLVQDGAAGISERRVRIRYENDQEVSRTVESEYVAVPPTTKIIGYGTNIIVRQLDTPNGPVEYWRKIYVLATSYSASTAGTPRTSPYYGITRLGWQMRHGIIAVDPDVIALRSNLYVPGYGVGVAGDTGGAIIGRHIDLGYDDDNLVLWYRWVDCYVLTPVPPLDEINYVLEY
jgi:uncharacterized protein YabE (DUF348 family)